MADENQISSNPIVRFFSPMSRTLLMALSGYGVFMFSIFTMIPLRMAENPVVNYNLFFAPIFALIVIGLFFKGCKEKDEARQVVYGFLTAVFAWPLIGEVATLPVDKGIITQFSNVDIKLLGGWIYVLFGWIFLFVAWKTKAVKYSIATFLMTFLGIWTFELYMDNYSSKIAVEMMPVIANTVAAVFGILSIVVLVISWRSKSLVVKSTMGAVFYLTISLVLMGTTQWKVPAKFYIKYHSKHILHEIEDMKAEYEHMMKLKKYMIEEGLYEEEESKAEKGAEETEAKKE